MHKLVFFLLLFSACSQTSSTDPKIVKSEVLAEMQRCEDGWNKGDLVDYMQSYMNSETIRFSGNNSYRFGWNNVLENYKRGYPDKETMGHLKFTEMDVTPITNTDALVFGRFNTMRAVDTLTGLFTLLIKKTEDGWRIVHDHSSADY